MTMLGMHDLHDIAVRLKSTGIDGITLTHSEVPMGTPMLKVGLIIHPAPVHKILIAILSPFSSTDKGVLAQKPRLGWYID